jgi:ABC-2 type transport system ATP-binding protein
MSEMALTADHLIVIGRGKLIAATSVEEFVSRSSNNHVLVRTEQPDQLLPLLDSAATVVRADDGALRVIGINIRAIGDIAAAHRITLHELSPQMASLEEAFMELTHDSVDYNADVPTSHLDVRKVA